MLLSSVIYLCLICRTGYAVIRRPGFSPRQGLPPPAETTSEREIYTLGDFLDAELNPAGQADFLQTHGLVDDHGLITRTIKIGGVDFSTSLPVNLCLSVEVGIHESVDGSINQHATFQDILLDLQSRKRIDPRDAVRHLKATAESARDEAEAFAAKFWSGAEELEKRQMVTEPPIPEATVESGSDSLSAAQIAASTDLPSFVPRVRARVITTIDWAEAVRSLSRTYTARSWYSINYGTVSTYTDFHRTSENVVHISAYIMKPARRPYYPSQATHRVFLHAMCNTFYNVLPKLGTPRFRVFLGKSIIGGVLAGAYSHVTQPNETQKETIDLRIAGGAALAVLASGVYDIMNDDDEIVWARDPTGLIPEPDDPFWRQPNHYFEVMDVYFWSMVLGFIRHKLYKAGLINARPGSIEAFLEALTYLEWCDKVDAAGANAQGNAISSASGPVVPSVPVLPITPVHDVPIQDCPMQQSGHYPDFPVPISVAEHQLIEMSQIEPADRCLRSD